VALVERAAAAVTPSIPKASGRGARVLALLGCAVAVAALTALVFLVRAGDVGDGNWPANWDLRISDNGVLFQVAADVFSGHSLDWSFSPQVYVFPEIPISLAAYALAGGSVQLYYLVVAALNNALLFLGLFAVIRYLFPADALRARLARAGIAVSPLLVLPLFGATPLYAFHLAPTYYFGMYLLIVTAPALYLARSSEVRLAVALGLALTGASNPLAFIFTVPALACVAVIRGRADGWRAVRPAAAWTGAVVVAAGAVRVLFFHRLQGGSPFAYVDSGLMARRIEAVHVFLHGLMKHRMTGIVTVVGALLAAAGVAVAVADARRYRRHAAARPAPGGDGAADVTGARLLTRAYYGLVPLTGIVATVPLLITNYLYLWPVLVAPLVLALIAVPRRAVGPLLAAGVATFVAVGLATGASGTVAQASSRYFDYRSDETRCLDAGLPAGVTVGYATFSDARRLSLTSARPFRLIQLTDRGQPALWLTNRAYVTSDVGRFFYFNDSGDETVIDSNFVVTTFGRPDGQLTCGMGKTVWLYDDPAKLAAIAHFYGVRTS
jgi:hypothetical protein